MEEGSRRERSLRPRERSGQRPGGGGLGLPAHWGAAGDILRKCPGPLVEEVCMGLSNLFSLPGTCHTQLAVALFLLQQAVSECVRSVTLH